jgi:hypothetical protein
MNPNHLNAWSFDAFTDLVGRNEEFHWPHFRSADLNSIN